MKEILKLGLVLAIFATAACVGLAFVYSGTKGIIEQRQQADLETALRELFPDADEFVDITGSIPSADPLVSFETEYAAQKAGDTIGVVIRSSRGSYGGPIKVLIGVGIDGRISKIKILEHQDTPGLGANAASDTYYVDKAAGIRFYDQFAGKSTGDPFEAKDDVIAITAATITSRAVALAVKAAGEAATAWLAVNAGGSL